MTNSESNQLIRCDRPRGEVDRPLATLEEKNCHSCLRSEFPRRGRKFPAVLNSSSVKRQPALSCLPHVLYDVTREDAELVLVHLQLPKSYSPLPWWEVPTVCLVGPKQ